MRNVNNFVRLRWLTCSCSPRPRKYALVKYPDVLSTLSGTDAIFVGRPAIKYFVEQAQSDTFLCLVLEILSNGHQYETFEICIFGHSAVHRTYVCIKLSSRCTLPRAPVVFLPVYPRPGHRWVGFPPDRAFALVSRQALLAHWYTLSSEHVRPRFNRIPVMIGRKVKHTVSNQPFLRCGCC